MSIVETKLDAANQEVSASHPTETKSGQDLRE